MRLRNKTQMFSSKRDDHYHTRLIHSLQVAEISRKIASEISKNRAINFKLLNKIALLHDIGHTPYGHAGERALHDLCSGSYPNLSVDLKTLRVNCGFKHNINSGLLYIESTPFNHLNVKILEGIILHTKLYYSNDQNLDYGLGYIESFSKKQLIKEYKTDCYPTSIEGIIVYFADEIAQMCSDYIDLLYNSFENDNNRYFSDVLKELKISFSKGYRKDSISIAEKMINLFVIEFNKGKEPSNIEKGRFGEILRKFQKERTNILKNNITINEHDQQKKEYIYAIFEYYFKNPAIPGKDFILCFYNRCKNIRYSSASFGKNIRNFDCASTFLNYFVNEIKPSVENGLKSKSVTDDYRKIYKYFIMSLANYISKMTDNYADKTFEKIKNSN